VFTADGFALPADGSAAPEGFVRHKKNSNIAAHNAAEATETMTFFLCSDTLKNAPKFDFLTTFYSANSVPKSKIYQNPAIMAFFNAKSAKIYVGISGGCRKI
jgi:hypothetical protein